MKSLNFFFKILKFNYKFRRFLFLKRSASLLFAFIFTLMSMPMSADTVIPPDRFTPVVLSGASPDGRNLLVNQGGRLSVPAASSAVQMDSGTSVNNSGLIELVGEGVGPVIEATIPTDTSAVFITNNASGTIQWIKPSGAFGDLINFGATINPFTVSNAGTMTGGAILGSFGAPVDIFALTLSNSGTMNVVQEGGFGATIATGGGGYIGNTGVINLSGGVFAERFVIANSGLFDYSNPALLDPTASGNIQLEAFNITLNNSGTMGYSANSFQIRVFEDLQIINSGLMGSAASSQSGSAGFTIVAGTGSNGSSLVNTSSGRIANSNTVIDFSRTLAPSSIVNQGAIIGEILVSENTSGPTTLTVGGPFSSVLGNIRSENLAVNNQLDIVDDFTYTNSIINIRNIAVKGGTFNAQDPNSAGNGAILGFNQFTVASGARAILGGLIEGIEGATLINNGSLNLKANNITVPGGITNNGTLNIENINTQMIINGGIINNGRLNLMNNIALFRPSSMTNNGVVALTRRQTITGDYFQTAGGVFSTTLTDLNNYGSLNIAGNSSFANGTTVEVLLASNNTVMEGNFFDVITSQNGLPGASAFLIDSSTVPTFTFAASIVNGNTLKLTALLIPIPPTPPTPRPETIRYAATTAGPNEQAIAEVFDDIRANPHDPRFDRIFAALDGLSPEAREEAFSSISPEAYAPAGMASFAAQAAFINKVTALLDLQRQASLNTSKTGYMAGDMNNEGRFSFSPIYFNNIQKLQNHDRLPGYRAATNGFGLLWDGCVTSTLRLGLGAGVTDTQVKAGRLRNKKNDINSYQGVLYGSYEDGPVFIDGILTLAHNRYNAKQNVYIRQIYFKSKAKYNASQYAVKMRAGYGIPVGGFEVQPLATVFITQVNQAEFRQKGANVINMNVDSRNSQRIQGGLGGKLAYTDHLDCWVPEVHALFLHDFKNSSLRTSSAFVGGGPGFDVRGAKVARNGVNLGLSLSAMVTDDLMVMGGYDVEAAKRFKSYSGTLRARWLF